ncbi:hypothetical protein FSP39_018815 [Pinctada imbricata]|uniref:Mutator-like transposase domain-containing protein n=1 Tax=Pinctada imbricata TaxID=66713 RepID=A0AA88XIU1_PINIB|nr:hypothetical protein FSP39_018815 [Pinctada imbricata]
MHATSCSKSILHFDRTGREITAGFDGAWQKRGTGRAYNSLTGHTSLIGEKIKKRIGYSVMGKRCRIYDNAKKKDILPRKHKCPRNYQHQQRPWNLQWHVRYYKKKGGDLQQDLVAASTVKHQNTRCKNTKDEYSTRRKRDTRHLNIKHKRLHINRRDQWVTGADFGRLSVTQVANGVVILDYVRTTLSLLQLPRGLEERTIVV